MKTALHRKKLLPLLLAAALAGASLAGCGSGGEEAPPAPDYAQKLAGSPAPLAALHDQADELLPGGLSAYDRRIDSLEGFPAVVNVWASWCGPCRSEFPLLQQASAEMGTRVAFLGVNSDDNADAAATFLSSHPVPYPSYSDPDKEIANDLGAVRGFPVTAFYDASGERTYVKHGEFRNQEELDDHIREYALGTSPG